MTTDVLPAAGVLTQDSRQRLIRAAQVRILYSNLQVGIAVTLAATTILARLQWSVISHAVILSWWLYAFIVSLARFALERLYRYASPNSQRMKRWHTAFAVGAGLAGVGWGAAGIFLYPPHDIENQVFLTFILGGMMLGGASLLAPRSEAFLAFMLPTGVAPVVRLLLQGDELHVGMGVLAALFVAATIVTTRRVHFTILASLKLQFENHDLVESLRVAKNRAEALNQHLEARVQERTAELQHSTEQLRAEIRQREQIEEELLRARKLESLGVLAGGIAHDFNNFLTVVHGNVEMAKMQLGKNQPVWTILERTATACRRAALLSSQLLTFAKGGVPVRRLVSVARLVKDAAILERAGTETRIELNIPENLWSAQVDPGQIGHVLHNILINARQSMVERGIIEVQAENVICPGEKGPEPRVRISIRDYGCGIPFDILPRVFDPYFTTKPGGRGLGLATSYAIIAKHGGSLSAESRPGQGAVFTIDLPASLETPPEEDARPALIHSGTERILVMDDEEGLRELLRSVLSSLGYEVSTARDGAEAIALCEAAKAIGRGFDVVLLDLTVNGGMGGMEAVSQLRELDPALKLIVSSGYSDAPVMSEFKKYGFDDVIPKPWRIPELSEVLKRVLASHPDRKPT